MTKPAQTTTATTTATPDAPATPPALTLTVDIPPAAFRSSPPTAPTRRWRSARPTPTGAAT